MTYFVLALIFSVVLLILAIHNTFKLKAKARVIMCVVAVAVALIASFIFFTFGGRDASRLIGDSAAQTLKLENLRSTEDIVSVNFDPVLKCNKKDIEKGATVKDVSYIANDGYLYTKEFKDVSPLKGVIRWVPYGAGSDWIQSRGLSRWFGDVVDLELPEGCQAKNVQNIDISFYGPGERVKNLSCLLDNGEFIVDEYKEGIIERKFSGRLKVVAK